MKNTNERLGIMETELKNVIKDMGNLKASVDSLHGKFDAFAVLVSSSYVSKETFDEWKKNRWLERILIVLATGTISALIAFFLRENRI